ncbi:MAG: hypothetical protein BWZ02_01453 [Lentisphaerae bacterium ADurb.BinA184]|nr:MAG: hypothetical protein BWZ02_01453 [Lentisphaerae bacterium ADurb.BinA184]
MAIGAGVFGIALLTWLYLHNRSKGIEAAVFGGAHQGPRS